MKTTSSNVHYIVGKNQRIEILNSLNNTDTPSHLTLQLENDCQDWLEYTLHAFGDEYIYRSGVEALAYRYQLIANKDMDSKNAVAIIQEMDKMVTKYFLNESVLEKFEEQKNKGFNNKSPINLL